MLRLNSYCIEENEHLYGPGKRLIIYTQGCSIHCKGCINYKLWSFEGGSEYAIADILKLLYSTEGITILGGEPLDQANDILALIKAVKEIDKTVILFTGYNKNELGATARKCWELSDIVIAGRFVIEKRNINLQFRGSTNQRVYTHKGKYKSYKIKDDKTVSILNIDENGLLQIRGFIDDEMDELLELLKNK